MTRPWTSTAGVEIPDLVPARLRREWAAAGRYPDKDLYRLFTEHADTHPDRAAVIDETGTVTYAELDRLVIAAAETMAGANLGPRDIIGIRVRNGRLGAVAELAAAALGAVSMPFPPGHGSRDARSLLRRSRATALVGDPGAHPRTITLTPHHPSGARPRPTIDPDSPARILVSSGSETEPKMVAYSHNAFAGGRAAYVRALHHDDTPMRNLVLVPLSSSFGSCGVPVTVAALGATLITQPRFDPADALRLIHEHRPTHVFGVPTMLDRLAARTTARPPGLRALVASGAALPPATRRRCAAAFGVPVISVYGSTDGVNCHDATTARPDPAVATIVVTDADGTPLPPGTPGEIRALGPMTPLSYVADPALNTRHRTPDGWVRTGDQGILDERGVLHVTGRLRPTVIRGGRTISPAEVELVLADHPAVQEATCVAVPDLELGERLCACVVPRPGRPHPTLTDLTTYLRLRHDLEPAKLPERLLVLDALPLGPTGKVCRTTLTELATEAPV
ncbi:class I adenylate-forming enzyme family protein [Actinophytocola gossypii]|uniref:Long-chain fatty acid--CoA ligase n=1 Tax=Actinophytocola gossypii TaxID=2812003 RepID=A0ABT2JCG0_9PSEU|nr:fatty acid--CoA ligase family protein [Actinophytocola gossypii]MCT2585554.1 long-chain fatty acid--CoA ligase [Actinophytocola gossypii]